MAQIFLSYSHSDSDFVELIEPRIARIFGEGVLWYDRKPDGLKGGQLWWSEILRQIQFCQIFLFLLSDNSAISESCTKELEEAISLNKTLIPVFLKTYSWDHYPTSYSDNALFRLNETQYVDLRDDGQNGYSDLSLLWGAIYKAQKLSLTPLERWILFNQYEIMEMLEEDPECKKRIRTEFLDVLQVGYELEFKNIMPIFEQGMSHNDCKEVMDILDMFQSIHRAIKGIDRDILDPVDVSNINESRIAFQGFDGNHESGQYIYTRFVIRALRYSEHILPDNGSLNSGIPMLERYRLMLKAWKKSSKKTLLTKEDIFRIAEAAEGRFSL